MTDFMSKTTFTITFSFHMLPSHQNLHRKDYFYKTERSKNVSPCICNENG